MKNTASFTRADLVAALGPAAEHLSAALSVTGVSTDTRLIEPGNVFVALIGEKFDGHDHVNDAFAKGAALAIVQHPLSHHSDRIIVVVSTLHALGSLAWYHRRRFHIPVVAIGGASGKTSTKELTAHVLSQRYHTLRTQANYNNQVGTPLTLLSLTNEHEAAVIEIGTNEPGEIELLAAMVQPTHGVITTIGPEHLEKLIDLDGVEKEETALFDYLQDHGGVMLVNVDDDRLRAYDHAGRMAGRVITFGLEYPADLRPTVSFDRNLHPTMHLVKDDITFRAPMQTVGLASALNATAAIAVGWSMQLSAEEMKLGLESYQPPAAHGYARMVVEHTSAATVLNDTYNANPQSMLIALQTLARYPATRRLAVLGDMRELGAAAATEHDTLLAEAVTYADLVMVMGEDCVAAAQRLNHPHVLVCDSHRLCADFVRENSCDGCVVLVKGSRGMRMEQVIHELRS